MYLISYRQDGKVKQTRVESYRFESGLVKCIIDSQTGFNFKANEFVSVVEADLINPQDLRIGEWYQFRTGPAYPWSLPLENTYLHDDWPPYQFRKIPKP